MSLINHTFDSNYEKINTQKDVIVLNKNLDFITEIKIFFLRLNSMFELFFLYLRKEIDYRSYFKLNLSLFDSSTTFSLKINYQIQNIVKKVDPKFCVLTYEGYSWERMSINGVKKFNNKIQCVGYQHTSLTKNHYSIFNFIKGHLT